MLNRVIFNLDYFSILVNTVAVSFIVFFLKFSPS